MIIKGICLFDDREVKKMEGILMNISYIVSIVIEIGVPVIIAFYMWKKYKISWAIFFLGMLLFLVSLTRIPLNNVFSSQIGIFLTEIMVFIFAGISVAIIYILRPGKREVETEEV